MICNFGNFARLILAYYTVLGEGFLTFLCVWQGEKMSARKNNVLVCDKIRPPKIT